MIQPSQKLQRLYSEDINFDTLKVQLQMLPDLVHTANEQCHYLFFSFFVFLNNIIIILCITSPACKIITIANQSNEEESPVSA